MRHQCPDGQNSRSSPPCVLLHTRRNSLSDSDNETLASVLFCEKSHYCLSESITVRIFTPRHKDTHCSSYEMLPFQPRLLYFCLPPTPGLSLTSQRPPPPDSFGPPWLPVSLADIGDICLYKEAEMLLHPPSSSLLLFAPPHTHTHTFCQW